MMAARGRRPPGGPYRAAAVDGRDAGGQLTRQGGHGEGDRRPRASAVTITLNITGVRSDEPRPTPAERFVTR